MANPTTSRARLSWLAVALWLALGACVLDDGPLDPYRCSAGGICPAGKVCVDGFCAVLGQGEPDAGDDVAADLNRDTDPDVACEPECGAMRCGVDPRCGQSCGECDDDEVCTDEALCCRPDCADNNCGDDGCGGSCGECVGNDECTAGQCVCEPVCTFSCEGRSCPAGSEQCGQTVCLEVMEDGCGGSCSRCGCP